MHAHRTASSVAHDASPGVQNAERIVRTDNAVFDVISFVFLKGAIHTPFGFGAIFGMYVFEESFVAKLLGLYFEDAAEFGRPAHGIGGNVPFPTADVRQRLRLVQLRFATRQFSLRA